MSNARQAIRSAVDAGATEYAPYELRAAQQLMEEAEAKLQSGAYGDARRLALDARTAAIRARESAKTKSLD